MLYAIIAEDVPGSLDKRLAARPAHVERLKALAGRGPPRDRRPASAHRRGRPGPGRFLGLAHRGGVRLAGAGLAWAGADPYVAAGVYAKVTVKPFRKALP